MRILLSPHIISVATNMTSHLGITSTLALLILLSLSGTAVYADGDDDDVSCETYWDLYNGYCYYFSGMDDVLGFSDAGLECLLKDGELVWPQSEEELQYLQTYVASTVTYGWWLNVLYNEYLDGYPAWVNELDGSETPISDDQLSALPTLYSDHEMSSDPNKNCLAFHVDANAYETEPWYQSIDCSLNLRVACQGKLADFPDTVVDGNKYFSSGDYLFYLPGTLATHDDSKDTCTANDMGLIDQAYAFLVSLDHTPVIDGTPFWSAATLGSDGPEWENGTPVDTSQFIWDSDVDEHSSYFFAYVLTNSGRGQLYRNYESQWPEAYMLPYICKKLPVITNEYDCPTEWIRAGRSCYLHLPDEYSSWDDAKGVCEATEGAHLLSINSQDERLWLTTVLGPKISYRTWTSANDLESEGNFTWYDGSDIDTTLFPWSDGGSYGYALEYHCVLFNTGQKYMAATSCDWAAASPACQYSLDQSGSSRCADGWTEYGGQCYFLSNEGVWVTHEVNVLTCLANLEGVDSRLVISLQVQSEDVMDFLAREFDDDDYWTGAETKDVIGEYVWADGTVDDFSFFVYKPEPDDGSSEEPEDCVCNDGLFYAFDKPCHLEFEFICELELPPLTTESLRGSSPTLEAPVTAMTVLAVATMIVVSKF